MTRNAEMYNPRETSRIRAATGIMPYCFEGVLSPRPQEMNVGRGQRLGRENGEPGPEGGAERTVRAAVRTE